jgi:hypothetical protein
MSYPQIIYVYVGNDGLAVAETMDKIPDEMNGEKIGRYTLDGTGSLRIARTILPPKKGKA